MTNPHEELNRLRKVTALLPVVHHYASGLGMTPSVLVRGLSNDFRDEMCREAGIKIGSDATWDQVIETLEAAERRFSGVFG